MLESGSGCLGLRRLPILALATTTPIVAARSAQYTWMATIVLDLVTGGMVGGTAIASGDPMVGDIGTNAD